MNEEVLAYRNYYGILMEKIRDVLSAESVCTVKVHSTIGHDIPEGE